MLDLNLVPFSHKGSFLTWSVVKGSALKSTRPLAPQTHYLVLRDVRGGDLDPGHLFYLLATDAEGADLGLRFKATEYQLSVYGGPHDPNPLMALTFEDGHTLRIKSYSSPQHLSLQLIALPHGYNTLVNLETDAFEFTSYFKELKLGFTQVTKPESSDHGQPFELEWHGTWHKHIALNLFKASEWALQVYRVTPRARKYGHLSFDKCVARSKRDFEQWLNACYDYEGQFSTIERQAAHVLWQNFVPKGGMLKYDALYMTKNFMTNIWSWDNYFSALGLAHLAPKSALEQILMFYPLQSAEGALPDYANDQYASYSCNKPPLLGFAMGELKRLSPYFAHLPKDKMRQLYDMAQKQVMYWLNHRMSTLGLPYYAHGNDSGWDNGHFFSKGVPAVTPDLATFLILQTDFLADHAPNPEAQFHWKNIGNHLLKLLLDNLWDGRQFCAYKLPERIKVGAHGPSTLQALLPLLLGRRLPQAVVDQMLSDLKGFDMTWGLATEHIKSPLYTYNGYWRGPIWAPTTYLFISALQGLDKDTWAKDLAQRFMQVVEIGGLSENFDPISGQGLVDTGFAWTASVFIALKRQYGNLPKHLPVL